MKIRPTKHTDLSRIINIQAECYHEVVPERVEVLREKLELFPKGCFVAEIEREVVGYVFSHPWILYSAPKLDSFIVEIPKEADSFYIHDLAVSSSFRGLGISVALFKEIEVLVKMGLYKHLSLIAVQNSKDFWGRFGFNVCIDNLDQMKDIICNYQLDADYMIKLI